MPSMSARGLGLDRSVAPASTYMGPHTHAAYTGPRAPAGPRYDQHTLLFEIRTQKILSILC